MKTITKLLLCFVALFCAQSVLADDDYKEYANKVRESVWAWDNPAFKNYNVSDEYKNESVVVLANHYNILATGKSKFRVNWALAFNINKELLYTYTRRVMLKINDKKALEEYSTISYREQDKEYGYMMTSKYKTIIGARIIKPDGTIQEVNVDEAIAVTEGKKDKENHKKLAISGLQVGDILDYFIQNEGHVDTENIPPLDFGFVGEYPIMSYSIHCEIGDKLTTEYRCINGAPEFTVSTNENNDVILDVEKKNIPKVEGSDRWISYYRTYPMIRMSILNNASKSMWKPMNARKKGLYKNLPAETIMEDARSEIGIYLPTVSGEAFKATKKLVDKYKKANPNVSKEELAAYIYDAFQYNWGDVPSYSRNNGVFVSTLFELFKKFKIEHKAGFVTSRFGARADEIANMNDVHYFVLANDNKQIFIYRPLYVYYSGLAIGGESSPYFEGETAITYADIKYKKGLLDGLKGEYLVPTTSAEDNNSREVLKVQFSKDDMLHLNLESNITTKGYLKHYKQEIFFTNDKRDKEMRERLGIEKTMLEEIGKNKKWLESYKTTLEEDAKALKENVKASLRSNHYDIEPLDIAEYEIKYLGITPKNPNFEMYTKYTLDGFVKKAGANYILEAGKLIGSQIELKGEERKRSFDLYMPSARSYDNIVEVEIPEGYTVENIEALNKSVDNVTGSFKSTVVFENGILKIITKKVYKNIFEPKDNWPLLLEMLDCTNDFSAQTVVLKKK